MCEFRRGIETQKRRSMEKNMRKNEENKGISVFCRMTMDVSCSEGMRNQSIARQDFPLKPPFETG